MGGGRKWLRGVGFRGEESLIAPIYLRAILEPKLRSKSGTKAVCSFCNGPEFWPPSQIWIGLDWTELVREV
ncbi:hypothetical protein Pfo_020235 [Paulownia fortunei]|nr:hypothetical protein Pfo_020235 [Paulownia fortunei]